LRVLVAGGEGFVGRHIVVALEAAGHEVIAGVRQPAAGHLHSITCDFSRDLDPHVWSSRLAGIDIVVNAIGILREPKSNSFARIHIAGPTALFQGCILAGARRSSRFLPTNAKTRMSRPRSRQRSAAAE
jgi:nucleoside-diphosphate-sugar epimerase